MMMTGNNGGTGTGRKSGQLSLHGHEWEGEEGCSLIHMDPMVPRQRGRMVKAFSALGASVWFLHRQNALFGEGVVWESLPGGNGAVLLRLGLWRLWLWRLLLFALQVNSLMPGEGRGVIEPFATVSAGVALSL